MRIWVKLSKRGPAIFISHLDLLRTIERSLRRAQLPVALSEGYRPRLRLAFGPALPLGVSSDGEYIDIQLSEDLDIGDFMNRMRKASPSGIDIVDAREVPAHFKSLNALIDTASYDVKLRYPASLASNVNIAGEVAAFLDLKEILITREGKEGRREVNIADFIERIRILTNESGILLLEMLLAIGARGSVKPEEVITALSHKNKALIPEEICVHRNEVFMTTKDGKRISPMEYSRIFFEKSSGR
jgi:radical SAM-linked protein